MANKTREKKAVERFKQRLIDYEYSSQVIYYYPQKLHAFLKFCKLYARNNDDEKYNNPDDAGISLLVKWRDHLLGKDLSKATINKRLAVIRTWYKFRFDDDPTSDRWRRRKNDAKDVCVRSRGKRSDSGYKAISIEQLRSLVSAAEDMSTKDNCEIEAFIKTLVFTGGRAQFYGLLVDNIDWDDNTISLEVKGKKKHEITMVKELREVLKRHLDSRSYNSEYVFKYGKHPYVPSDHRQERRNQQANGKNAERIVDRVAQKAGLTVYDKNNNVKKGERITPHRIRDTIGEEGGKLGLSLEAVHDILGHEDISTTKAKYRGRQHEKAARELEEADLLGRNDDSDETLKDMSPKQKKELIEKLLASM